jgi:hypothetical protein
MQTKGGMRPDAIGNVRMVSCFERVSQLRVLLVGNVEESVGRSLRISWAPRRFEWVVGYHDGPVMAVKG